MDAGVKPGAFRRIGLRAGFSSIVGAQEYLRREYGMDPKAIAKTVAAVTAGRKPEAGDRFRLESTALFLHLFTPEEAKAEIEASGFTVAHFGDSPEAHMVAIKNRS